MRKFFRRLLFWITAPFRLVIGLVRRISRAIRNIYEFFTVEIEDEPLGEVVSKTVENPVGVLEHLDALRKHLFRALGALILTTALAFTFVRQLLEFLTRPLPGGMESLVAIEVTEPIGTVMRVSLLTGFALAFPYIAFEIWLFVAPGVRRRTRIAGLFAIPIATLFFLGGMAFAYYIMLPAALPFLLNFMGIATIPRPSSYISFATSLMFWIGVAFEFPLVIFILASMRLVKAKALRDQWRLAFVFIAVLAALITPTVDPVNMTLVMGPMFLLYLLSILLAKLAGG